MKKITILSSCNNTPCITTGDIGTFWQCAPDSDLYKKYLYAIQFDALLAETENTRRLASDIAAKIIKSEPPIRQLPQLSIFHESIANEVHKILRILKFYNILICEKYTICEFTSSSWLSEGLAALCNLTQSPLKVITPTLINNKLNKIYNKIKDNNFSYQFIELFKKIDKFHRRNTVLKKLKKNNLVKNKIWFYSTAVNYTNICLQYEKYLPEQPIYLVENSKTGGKPLTELNRPFNSVYSYSDSAFIPTKTEIQKATDIIFQHINNCSVNNEEEIAKLMFINSGWLTTFFKKLLPHGLLMSSIAKNWLRLTEPTALIVGNPVFEAYFTYQARYQHVPTIMLQHGLLGGYYPYADHPIDHYIIRGTFWYHLLSASSSVRAHVVNPLKQTLPYQEAKNKYIIFATTPASKRGNMYIDTNITLLLKTIFTALNNKSITLIIRVHPLENVLSYIRLVKKIKKNNNINILIKYSQAGNIDQLIKYASAVIMYCSTLFLDCIHHGIPIISFEWIQFGFMERLKQYNIFYLAKDLNELKSLIIKAINYQLPSKLTNTQFFLANQQIDVIKDKMNHLFIAN